MSDKDISFLKRKINVSKPGPLGHLTFKDEMSKGRKWTASEDEDAWMFNFFEPFVVDQQKIESSKAWRRLEQKQQVFPAPINSHIRNRQTHTAEVASIAALIAKALGLNVDLCVSIAKAHDVGHFPFGHSGERFVRKKIGKNFHHSTYGAILLQEIERQGKANFSFEVLEGITFHSAKFIPKSKPQEYSVVRYADKIAFVSHDINDAVRMKLLSEKNEMNLLGKNQRERVKNCIIALLSESIRRGFVSFEQSDTAKNFWSLYDWMYENVYMKIDDADTFFILDKIYSMLENLCSQRFSGFHRCNPVILLSLMNDKDCINLFSSFVSFDDPQNILKNLSLNEIVPTIIGKEIDLFVPDFSWVK